MYELIRIRTPWLPFSNRLFSSALLIHFWFISVEKVSEKNSTKSRSRKWKKLASPFQFCVQKGLQRECAKIPHIEVISFTTVKVTANVCWYPERQFWTLLKKLECFSEVDFKSATPELHKLNYNTYSSFHWYFAQKQPVSNWYHGRIIGLLLTILLKVSFNFFESHPYLVNKLL